MELTRHAPAPEADQPRNPGPSWGFAFLSRAGSILPLPLFHGLIGIGTWVAVATMGPARRHSRQYLSEILGRRATLVDVWRHFFAFAKTLVLVLRLADGKPHRCIPDPCCEGFLKLMASGRPALLGSFHFGRSDLLGFMLGPFGRHVHMVRTRMGNSGDTRRLGLRFGKSVTFLWANATDNLLFVVRDVIQAGGTLALKCDRPALTAKNEVFEFLGAPRLFPFSIYHLAILFRRPVAFCVGTPAGPEASRIYTTEVFEPDDGPKDDNLERARDHFQGALRLVERLLREDPYLWFNFTPMNTVSR